MSWKCYQYKFQIKSPLHIGFHKVLHFSRTHTYVPGKLFWAALTAKLAPSINIDYQIIGTFLKKAICFGYHYLYIDNTLYLSQYSDNGFQYASLTLNDFEKKFICSMAFTAIDVESFTAEEGMLHEVEFISPYTIDTGKQIFLMGYIWIRECEDNNLKIIIENKSPTFIFENKKKIDLKEALNRLQIGGERRYGFGLIQLKEFVNKSSSNLNEFNGNWKNDDENLIIELKKDEPIWAHVKCSNSLAIKGDIKLLVEREWDPSKGAGRKIKNNGLFWVPGSVLFENKKFKITEFSFWEAIE